MNYLEYLAYGGSLTFLLITLIVSLVRGWRDCKKFKRYTGEGMVHYLFYRLKLWIVGAFAGAVFFECYSKGYVQESNFGSIGTTMFSLLMLVALLLPIAGAARRNTELEDYD